MSSALPKPGFSGLLTQWTWQPLALLALVALAGWYWRSVREVKRAGGRWSAGRSVVFALGLALGIWTTCGFLQAYVSSLFWVWTTQQLVLLLGVPFVLMYGGPVELARARAGGSGWIDRFLRSRTGRALSNPLVGPALVPVLSIVLFFGPLPAWAIQVPALGWVIQILLLAIGAFIALPLVVADLSITSLAVAITLAIGTLELILDAIPGIVLRLLRSEATSFYAHRTMHAWTSSPIGDQHTAGTILWCVSESIDIPFLLLMFRRWLQADERDAAVVDAVLEAERAARGGKSDGEAGATEAPADAPWWLSDPSMQGRLGPPERTARPD